MAPAQVEQLLAIRFVMEHLPAIFTPARNGIEIGGRRQRAVQKSLLARGLVQRCQEVANTRGTVRKVRIVRRCVFAGSPLQSTIRGLPDFDQPAARLRSELDRGV